MSHNTFSSFCKVFSPRSATQPRYAMYVSFLADVSMSVHTQHYMWMTGIGLDSKLVWKQHSLASAEAETRHSFYTNPWISLLCDTLVLSSYSLQQMCSTGVALAQKLCWALATALLTSHFEPSHPWQSNAVCSNICCTGSVSPGLDTTFCSRTEKEMTTAGDTGDNYTLAFQWREGTRTDHYWSKYRIPYLELLHSMGGSPFCCPIVWSGW